MIPGAYILASGCAVRAFAGQEPRPSQTDRIQYLIGQLSTGDIRASDAHLWTWGSGSKGDEAAAELARIGAPAVDAVIPVLKDAQEWRRAFAVDILERIRDHRADAPLVQALKAEREPGVKAHIASSIGTLRIASAASELVKCLHDADSQVQAAAARALGKLRYAAAVPDLLALLGKGRIVHGGPIQFPEPTEEAYLALARIGSPARAPLFNSLKDPNPYTRAHAALALGECRDREAVPRILGLIPNIDDYVAGCAMRAAGKIGDPVAVPALLKVLSSRNDELKYYAAEALGSVGDVRAVSPLIKLLKADGLQGAAARALGGIRNDRAIDALIGVVKGNYDRLATDSWSREMLRGWAMESLSQLRAKRAIPTIMLSLADKRGDVRRSAMRALGRMKATEALSAINAHVHSSDDSLERFDAVEAVARISRPAGVALLRDANSRVRSAAAATLWKVKNAGIIDVLISALSDAEARASAISSLARAGAVRALPEISRYISDSDTYVRRGAVAAVADLQTLERGGRPDK
jgi:HEAT repeat protein